MFTRRYRLGHAAASVLLLAAVGTTATGVGLAIAAAPKSAQPLLATPDQVEAERTLLGLLGDPELKALQARLKADLAQTAIGRTADGAARLDEVIAQWTNSLIFKEIIANRQTPAIVWGTEDSPRTWLGYTLGGVGTSGDNPDHIYRSSSIDGSGRYEITGQIDLAHRPAQFVLSVSRAQSLTPSLSKNRADLPNQIALLTDRDLKLGADGSFRVTLGGAAPAGGGHHVAIEPGPISVGFRDVLSDWNQRPARLTIRRLDRKDRIPIDRTDVRKRVLANLGPYVRFWSSYPERWFDGLKPNSISGPVPREGGWGFLAGLRFALAPDEAVLVTTTTGGAGYVGIQVVDPWMIASDAKRYQTNFNPSLATANADGSYSYVIAPRDPGVANWLDSAGLHDGFAVLRWQNLPSGATGEGLLRDFRVIKLDEAARIPGIALVAPEQRRVQLARRAEDYANRTR